MNLTYRGIGYPVKVQPNADRAPMSGKYRGIAWTSNSEAIAASIPSSVTLKYRGMVYHPSTSNIQSQEPIHIQADSHIEQPIGI